MKTDTKIILGAIIASVAILVGAAVVLGNPSADEPKRSELGASSMTIDKTSEDFGSMKVSDEKTATFTITNASDSTLRIWGVSTSCDCTFARITIDGNQTGEFNMPMHMNTTLKNWIGEVAAGKQAILNVTYKPSVMPVQGAVSRQVNFSTNDPKNPEVQVSVAANVL